VAGLRSTLAPALDAMKLGASLVLATAENAPMLPIGFVVPAVAVLLVALYVTVRELRAAGTGLQTHGVGPLVTNTGETMLIVAALCVFLQGWIGGLVLVPLGGFALFFGGALLFFVGMSLESLRAAR
jgi:hypothetical protein